MSYTKQDIEQEITNNVLKLKENARWPVIISCLCIIVRAALIQPIKLLNWSVFVGILLWSTELLIIIIAIHLIKVCDAIEKYFNEIYTGVKSKRSFLKQIRRRRDVIFVYILLRLILLCMDVLIILDPIQYLILFMIVIYCEVAILIWSTILFNCYISNLVN